ncbi:MAG: hypothetical protein DLM69_01805 [Candidatus Chloroheliales bacterium]|nr:MAG: hypothetical protein DLM69_01805 [Chloroflexota bacterium]
MRPYMASQSSAATCPAPAPTPIVRRIVHSRR